MVMKRAEELVILLIDGGHYVCIPFYHGQEDHSEEQLSQDRMAQAAEGMPVGSIDNALVHLVSQTHSLHRSQGRISVDVNDISLSNSCFQLIITIIIMEQAGADGRYIGNGKRAKLVVVLEQVVQSLAIVVGSAFKVLAYV
jgi:hypothetical protein